MNYRDVIFKVYEAFQNPLPGKEAHLELAPYRKNVKFNFEQNNPKIASITPHAKFKASLKQINCLLSNFGLIIDVK